MRSWKESAMYLATMLSFYVQTALVCIIEIHYGYLHPVTILFYLLTAIFFIGWWNILKMVLKELKK